MKGLLHSIRFRSTLLRNNPLGNSSVRNLLVYTPPGWKRGERLPGIVFLPGFGSGPEKWQHKDMPFHRLLDLLILDGSLPPCVALCADGMTRLGGSQYLDSSLNGPFARHIAEELVPYFEKKWGAKSGLSLCGHSSGGFGAIHLGAHYPELFPRIASFAGDMHFELTHKNMLAAVVNRWRNGELGANLKDCLKNKTTDYMLGLGAAYSPNLKKKDWKMDLPIDWHTGIIHESVWQCWLKFDPIQALDRQCTKLRQLDKFLLSVGDRDQYALHLGADAYGKKAAALGLKVMQHRHQGDHSLLIRQLEMALQFLTN